MKNNRKRKSGGWVSTMQLCSHRAAFAQKVSRLTILNSIWDRELGDMSKYVILEFIKNGTIFVKTKSSAVRQDLDLRKNVLIRSLNKHFRGKWIKRIQQI